MTIYNSNKRGGEISQPLETTIHNPQKDWLKYTQNGKSTEMSELLGNSCNSIIEIHGDGWRWCSNWNKPPPMDLSIQGWFGHWRSCPPRGWCNLSLQVCTEITQSWGWTALSMMGDVGFHAKMWKSALKALSLTSRSKRNSLLWKISQREVLWNPPLQYPSNTAL